MKNLCSKLSASAPGELNRFEGSYRQHLTHPEAQPLGLISELPPTALQRAFQKELNRFSRTLLRYNYSNENILSVEIVKIVNLRPDNVLYCSFTGFPYSILLWNVALWLRILRNTLLRPNAPSEETEQKPAYDTLMISKRKKKVLRLLLFKIYPRQKLVLHSLAASCYYMKHFLRGWIQEETCFKCFCAPKLASRLYHSPFVASHSCPLTTVRVLAVVLPPQLPRWLFLSYMRSCLNS